MFDGSTPIPLANQIPADAYYHLARTLRLTLPPPPGDSAEDFVRRDHAAIARVAALGPADAAEAELAGQFVAASEQWTDCLRLARARATSPEWSAKCRAQGLAMMRQANAALRLLLRLQGARRKLSTDDVARDGRAWAEHVALGLMAEALAAPNSQAPNSPAPNSQAPNSHAQGEEPAHPAKSAAPAPTPPAPQPAPVADPAAAANAAARIAAARLADDPSLLAAAEAYAAAYPERAATMRRTGKLPSDVRYFSPPEAALAPVLIGGQSPALLALDAPAPDASAPGARAP